MDVAARALPSMVETWIWFRHDWGRKDPDWWRLQETALQEVVVQAENVMGKYVRTRRRKSLDLYRTLWEFMGRAEGVEVQVSRLVSFKRTRMPDPGSLLDSTETHRHSNDRS